MNDEQGKSSDAAWILRVTVQKWCSMKDCSIGWHCVCLVVGTVSWKSRIASCNPSLFLLCCL